MRTLLLALPMLVSSTNAGASLNTSETTNIGVSIQPATFASEPAEVEDAKCGEPRRVLFILRDPSGAVVAMGAANVTLPC